MLSSPCLSRYYLTIKHRCVTHLYLLSLFYRLAHCRSTKVTVMQTIELSIQHHNGSYRIFTYFGYHRGINQIIKSISGAKYSTSKKAWHLPVLKEAVVQLSVKTKDIAVVDTSRLKQQLEALKKDARNKESRTTATTENLLPSNQFAFDQYIQTLVLQQKAESTIKTYKNEFLQYLKHLKNHPANEMDLNRIKNYFTYCFTTLNLSVPTVYNRINALKLYYEVVLGREKFFIELPRPKRALTLPRVLGENELTRLFNALPNLKHKAILFTAYSAGLRVSEVTAMQLTHVDSDRMQLFIKCAKGKKDRYASLSPVVLDILRAYIRQAKIKPLKYVFEGQQPGVRYSTRSAQKVFEAAKNKAGITKEITFHGLRHSFATHLLEKGIDVKFIQELLGHFDIKTTMRYIHVRKEQLVNIVSPIDDIFKKGNINW
ncbi:MAG: tyrosine-type recombinase/integrase [Segetibacter sp.]|nr:tyrosine-type recombinase/integrase [Segetibacter sp.]